MELRDLKIGGKVGSCLKTGVSEGMLCAQEDLFEDGPVCGIS